jgi:hypothetical protein
MAGTKQNNTERETLTDEVGDEVVVGWTKEIITGSSRRELLMHAHNRSDDEKILTLTDTVGFIGVRLVLGRLELGRLELGRIVGLNFSDLANVRTMSLVTSAASPEVAATAP